MNLLEPYYTGWAANLFNPYWTGRRYIYISIPGKQTGRTYMSHYCDAMVASF